MLSESIRLQLADTSVKVVELVPPAVRTSLLPGHETSEWAMPLDGFVSEVMVLLESQPDAKEILPACRGLGGRPAPAGPLLT